MGPADSPLPFTRPLYPWSNLLRRSFIDVIRWPVLISMMVLLLGTGLSFAGEVDDSSLVVDAFIAFQAQDYQHAIEKIETLRHTFPDSPLHDVALLLLARSALKAGKYEQAARAVSRFYDNYPASPLKSSLEPELKQLADRWHAGEKFPPATSAQRPVASGQQASVAHLGSSGQQTVATPSPDSVRIVSLSGGHQNIPVGQRGSIPFELVNHGSSAVRIMLEPVVLPEMDPVLTIAGNNAGIPARLILGPGASSRGALSLRMPDTRVDGHRTTVSLQAISQSDLTLLQTMDAQVTAEAPLVRAVTRVEKQRVGRGELARFHVTLLNAGTIPAQDLTVKIHLPPHLVFLGVSGAQVDRVTAAGEPCILIGSLPPGKLEEFSISARVREDSTAGQEVRVRLEISHGHLQLKETFTSGPIIIQRR